jgi:hypothetical protein
LKRLKAHTLPTIINSLNLKATNYISEKYVNLLLKSMFLANDSRPQLRQRPLAVFIAPQYSQLQVSYFGSYIHSQTL